MPARARPRIRSLKPEIWSDEALTGSLGSRLLYVGLITQADDEGRQSANPALLRAQLFPSDVDLPVGDVADWLVELDRAGLVELYEADGRSLLHLRSWAHDQYIQKPTASKLPPPPGASPSTSVDPPEDDRKAPAGREGKGRERTGAEGTGDPRASSHDHSPTDPLTVVIHEVCDAKGADHPTAERIERLRSDFARPDLLAVAHGWSDWWLHGKGATKAATDPLRALRNWLSRQDPPTNVVPIDRADLDLYDAAVAR